MLKDSRKPLNDALENVNYLSKRVKELTFDEFINNEEVKKAFKYSFIELEEALNNFKKIVGENNFDDEYQGLIYLGNKIKHNYWANREKSFWESIKSNFDNLKEKLEKELIKVEF